MEGGFWYWVGCVLGCLMVLACVGWLGWMWLRSTQDRWALVARWLLSLPVLAFIFLYLGPRLGEGGTLGAVIQVAAVTGAGLVLAIIWGPYLIELFGKPLTSIFDGGDTPPEKEPLTSMVEARRKQGRYAEAAQLMREQLAECPGHFGGQMLLAEILAEDLYDLAGAHAVIAEILQQENHSPNQIAYALTRMADWYLKQTGDTEAARKCFERILDLFPDTPQAHMARQRLAHLPGVKRERQRPKIKLELPRADFHLGIRQAPSPPVRSEPSVEEQLQTLVEQLQQLPDDNEARERLADLYAGPCRRPDLAIEQLEQLIAQPHVPEAHLVRWFHRMADIYMAQPQGEARAREALERLVARNPESPGAASARRRLFQLAFEARKARGVRTVRLAPGASATGSQAGGVSAEGRAAPSGEEAAGGSTAPGET